MVKPVWNNAQRVNHQNFSKKNHPCAKKNLVPRAVLMKSGLVSINTARQNISKTAVLVNTARQVNAAHLKTTVNAVRPMSYLSKIAHSIVKRPIHKNTTFKKSYINQRVNTVRGKNVNTARPKPVVNAKARNPQQNRVAVRKNKTLIKAARTMLADSKLPTTFWAEAVNTACYVQNRVLVVKPHNKTPYEFFHGRTPTLSFMRPFVYPVTILNTIDHLVEKFDVMNLMEFLCWSTSLNSIGLDCANDIYATNKNNEFYKQLLQETKPIKDYILLPLWTADPPYSQDPKSSHDDGSKPLSDDGKKVDEDLIKDSKCNDQEKEIMLTLYLILLGNAKKIVKLMMEKLFRMELRLMLVTQS
ncbi:ribonuclease H-like domain-containing protein [Tanacetum coccineum]